MNAEQRIRSVVRTEEELIGIYKDAYIKLLERMDKNRLAKLDNRHLNALLVDVRNILGTLSKDTKSWVDKNVPNLYDTGAELAIGEIDKLGIEVNLAKLNRPALEIMKQDMFNELATGIQNVSRAIQSEIRRMAYQSVHNRLLFGSSQQTMTTDMYEQMKKAGITALVDRQGKRWDLLFYADTITRWKIREVTTRGTINTLILAGEKYDDPLLFDLVQISEHKGSCPICIPFQGNVYSISGKYKGYPKLVKMTPFHPRCRHVTTPFFEKLYTGDIAKLRARSNGETED